MEKKSYTRSQIMATGDKELNFLADKDLRIPQWGIMGGTELRNHIVKLLRADDRLLPEPEPKPEPQIDQKQYDDPLFDKYYPHLAGNTGGNSGPGNSLPLPTRRRPIKAQDAGVYPKIIPQPPDEQEAIRKIREMFPAPFYHDDLFKDSDKKK